VAAVIQSIAEVELARALLTANARRADRLVPVHILTLSSEFRRRRLQSDYQSHLQSLYLLREAQPLARGLWIPSSTSIVEHLVMSLVISGCPTPELQDHCDLKPLRFGLARRFVGPRGDFPRVAWETWLGAPVDSTKWAKELISKCMQATTLAVGESNLKIYRHWNGFGSRWCAITDVPKKLFQNVAMCKSGGGSTPATYFLCQFRDRRLHAVSEFPSDLESRFRMQIALASLNNTPDKYIVRFVGPRVELNCRPLPDSEKRMLMALGTFEEAPNQWKIATTQDAFQIMQAVFAQLGLEEKIV
jgi:hypothetical protein